MKHNTFLRKLPMIIGALTIILFSLMAAECPSSDDDDDKKAATLSFTLEEDAKKTTATVEKKTDGGVDANGKALVSGKGKTYYTTDAPDGNKFFTLTAKAAKSKGTITYKLKKVGLDDKKKLKIDDAKEVDGKVDKGKVTIKDKKDGFYYLEATVAANGDYKAASAKALLLVGAVPLTNDYVVLDTKSFETTGGDNDMTSGTTKLAEGKVTVTDAGDTEKDKKFTLKAKIDYTKLPKEAPKPDATFAYTIVNTGTTTASADVIASVDAAGLATLASAKKVSPDVDVKAATTLKAPYSTTALAAKKIYTLDWN